MYEMNLVSFNQSAAAKLKMHACFSLGQEKPSLNTNNGSTGSVEPSSAQGAPRAGEHNMPFHLVR